MKQFVIYLLTLCAVVHTATASAHPDDDGVLRILAIGNSFSDDGTEYIPALLDNLGVKDVEIARLFVGGCTLQQHLSFYQAEQSPYIFSQSKAGDNRWVRHKDKYSLQRALAMGEWDIITLQQQSGRSGIYSSYEPYLGELIQIIRQSQPHALLAWHMTWSYSTNSRHGEFVNYDSDPQKMFGAIYDATQATIKAHPEIEIIIAAGTTVQTLRHSAVNNYPHDLTRDGYHIGYGAGRYALACTWYEALIEPYTNVSMVGNTLSINKGMIAVTPLTAAYCQQAARQAVRHNFSVGKVRGVRRTLRKIEHNNKFNPTPWQASCK